MAFSTRIKDQLNRFLQPLNLQLETRTSERREQERLDRLIKAGYFARPAFPLPDSIRDSDWIKMVPAFADYRGELGRLQLATTNDVGFANSNPFYHSPDSDVLYAMVRKFQPARIVEIGSGNSTRLIRQAIRDGGLSTRILSIDPQPRLDVSGFTDEIRLQRVEDIPADELIQLLEPGDFLFIDSSHYVTVGNDCVYEFLALLPKIKAGVIVHVHDITLPWDYPVAWLRREPSVSLWAEQYLLQSLLIFGNHFEVLWPGYYVQQTAGAAFDQWFPHRENADATSFWMRRKEVS